MEFEIENKSSSNSLFLIYYLLATVFKYILCINKKNPGDSWIFPINNYVDCRYQFFAILKF